MNRLRPDADDARFIRRIVLILLILAITAALFRAGDLLILAFGSILGAIVIHAIADLYADHLPLGPKRSLTLSIVTVLAVLGFLAWLFGVAFRQQLNTLVTQLPILLDQLANWASQSPVGEKIVDAVRAAYAGSRVAQDISGIVSGAGEFVLNCLLLLVGALFFAADPKVYERGFLLLIPRSMRPALEDALFDTGSTLRLWLRAQLIQMTTMGVLVGIGLGIAGVPSAAALGLLTGLSEFVPYVGPIAAMLPALGLAAQGGNGAVIGTLVTFAVVRLIQTNAITPFVTSRVVAIPPAITLFAIIGIGTIFGLFGLFFSAALLVVAFTLIRSLYLREVLGEDIPRSEHKTLLGPNAFLKKDASSPD
ncbi:AI-2E family transporter [Sphingomonas pseudosanguinis]|uniref:Putative PurR-regulated permease PerM n=1 Tax=Sphingomonas pseudosanguinis TaxID=413712 RepID=A0A7W6AFE9_9SPHN|nr:AI-2E family transporter [Sphingomonas pseudosanguinis]MBB3879596.1 putative PurR-regulated permease PerM [Sphingomonas pseudosanguinis]MBN3538310.1 AI-2E family transporter [Sphingomonas pseudosanguinis]